MVTFTLIPVADFLILTWHLPSTRIDSPNLPADLLTVSKSTGRFAEFNKSAGRNVGVSISAGRLTDFHKIDWPIYWLLPNLLADLLPFTKSASRNEVKHWLSPNLPADLLTVTKSTGRFADIHTKTSGRNEGMFLLANILIVTKSARRFAECWLNLLTEMWGASVSAAKFMDSHKIYWPIYWMSPNLPADLLTLMKSANRNVGGVYTIRFTDCHQICWQICWLWPNLLAEMGGISASIVTDSHEICWQTY